MDANHRTPASSAGTFTRSILNQSIALQKEKPHCCEQAAKSCLQTSRGSDMPRVYITPIYNRKEYLALTLQYFADELEGFNRLSKKFGLSPTALLKKAVDAGMPLVVASMEAKNNETKPNTNKS